VLCIACGFAHAKESIVIGAVPGMAPPLDMADSVNHCSARPGLPRGISADFANAVASALGIDPDWRFFPDRPAMIAALRLGDIDMATGATGEDAGEPLAFSRPYLPTKLIYVEPRRVCARRIHRSNPSLIPI